MSPAILMSSGLIAGGSLAGILIAILAVVPSVGIPVVALAMVGLVIALRRRQGLDVLIVCLTVVVVAFFELWPVKGFQYLIPLVTPVALLAADGTVSTADLLVRASRSGGLRRRMVVASAGLVLLGTSCIALGAGSIGVIAAPAAAIAATDSDQTADPATLPAGYAFVAGTGGYTEHPETPTPATNSQVLNNDTFGVLRLVLRPGAYSWQFVPVAGGSFTDSGSGSCR